MCKHKCDAFPALGLTKQGSFNYLQLFTLPYQLSVILFFTFSSIFDKYFIWTRRSLAVSRSPANRNLRVKHQNQQFSNRMPRKCARGLGSECLSDLGSHRLKKAKQTFVQRRIHLFSQMF